MDGFLAFAVERIVPALNAGLWTSLALIVPSALLGVAIGVSVGTLRVYGAPARGWSAAVQDKGHLEELRVFARYLESGGEPPIPLAQLLETAKASFAIAGQLAR